MQNKATIVHESGKANVALIASDGFRIFQKVLATTVLDEFLKGLKEFTTAAAAFATNRYDLVVWTILDIGDETRFRKGQMAMPCDRPVVGPQPCWILIPGRKTN